MAERKIMALIKTGKLEVAQDNSALDKCNVPVRHAHEGRYPRGSERTVTDNYGRTITKKYKVTGTKGEKFEAAVINRPDTAYHR